MNLVFVTFVALTCFVSAVASDDWSYADPSKWKNDFPSCGKTSQSPIHIPAKAEYHEFDEFKFHGYDTPLAYKIKNNGHTIQLDMPDTDVTVNGGDLKNRYKALQFHFHWSANNDKQGSEHILNNMAYPLEVHIVHRNTAYKTVTEALQHKDGLAVLGFFFEIGAANSALNKIVNNFPEANKAATTTRFSLSELIDTDHDMDKYYRYNGSLTTPPCSEAVVWTVFNKILTLSSDQLDKFWKVKDSYNASISNFRPLQGLNNRRIYISFHSSGMITTAVLALVALSVFLSTNLW